MKKTHAVLCCVSPDDVCPDLHSRVGSAVYSYPGAFMLLGKATVKGC